MDSSITTRLALGLAFALSMFTIGAAEPVPHPISQLLGQYCADCHAQATSGQSDAEESIHLDIDQIDWHDRSVQSNWEHVHTMIRKQIMPPKDAEPLEPQQRKQLLQWIQQSLLKHQKIGGSGLRRLCRREYGNTIRSVLELPSFEVPLSFPADNLSGGFDNQSEALVVAASHLEALAESAALVADQFFPRPRPAPKPRTHEIPAEALAISYSSACMIDGAMRLGSSGKNIVRHAIWPQRFEAPASGRYQVSVVASSMNPPEQNPVLVVSSMGTDRSNPKEVQELTIAGTDQQTFSFDADLIRGQTLCFRYANGPLDYDNKGDFEKQLLKLFAAEPVLATAWRELKDPARGGSGWERLKEAMEREGIRGQQLTEKEVAALAKKVASNSVKAGETLVYKYFEQGPNIGLHKVSITGPIEVYPDPEEIAAKERQKKLLGEHFGKTDPKTLSEFFGRLLSRAFRRPASEAEVASYVHLVRRELQRGSSYDDSMHLALRTCFISPAFLYREISEGELVSWELASRLSYFLTGGPPDDKLLSAAVAGKLSTPSEVKRQVLRLAAPRLARDFVHQWLGTSAVDRIMPDTRVIKRFQATHRQSMREEVEQTFTYLLRENRPVTEFIAPSYLFTDEVVGWEVYRLEQFRPPKKGKKPSFKKGMQRVEVAFDGHHGGLLCMAATMLSTANGVDTQPVLRGVWVLDRILGDPPPEPPDAVPALTPDTRGAHSPRQRLAAHMSEDQCAVCHRSIDPLGFVLESFDPIGRWRQSYPQPSDANEESSAIIDTAGVLPDGTRLQDVTDLKKAIVADPEPFARCLSEKLLSYATGRKMNFRERHRIAEIVRAETADGLRFADLLVALIDSEVFRTK